MNFEPVTVATDFPLEPLLKSALPEVEAWLPSKVELFMVIVPPPLDTVRPKLESKNEFSITIELPLSMKIAPLVLSVNVEPETVVEPECA